MISTNDIEKIKQLVIDEKIDGVLAGASEFNLQMMQKVTSEMGLPCYFTKEQWDVMSNKLSFKNLCMKYNIPVPLKYDVNIDSSDDELKKIKYPVMVKPVDCSSGLGIHSCRNMSELREGMADAFEKSFSHVIIVEQEIQNGVDFTATYNIVNGECALSVIGLRVLRDLCTEGIIWSGIGVEKYKKEINDNVISMIQDIGIKNGTFFTQGIVDRNFDFWTFEAGIRLEGTTSYKVVDLVNNFNAMKNITDYSLNGKIDADILQEDPMMKGKFPFVYDCMISDGKIGKIIGVDKIAKMKNIIDYRIKYKVGDVVDGKKYPLKRMFARWYLIADSLAEIKNIVSYIKDNIEIYDDKGNDMIIHSQLFEDYIDFLSTYSKEAINFK